LPRELYRKNEREDPVVKRSLTSFTPIEFSERMIAVLYPGYLLFCWGSALAAPASARVFGWIAVAAIVLGVLGIALNRAQGRSYQHNLDQLDGNGK
jgi:hypothetical protein